MLYPSNVQITGYVTGVDSAIRMISTAFYDSTYDLLVAAIVGLLSSAIFMGLRKSLGDPENRNRAIGTALISLGTLVSLVVGVSLDIMAKNSLIGDLLYQQAHFSVIYAGFALILSGIDLAILRAMKPRSLTALVWVLFAVSVVVTASFLFDASTYTITYSGSFEHVAQQKIFYLPVFLALTVAAAGPLVAVLTTRKIALARQLYLILLGLFSIFAFVGMLREATITPSSGDPLTDLLAAFVPFLAASICIFLCTKLVGEEKKAISQMQALNELLRPSQDNMSFE